MTDDARAGRNGRPVATTAVLPFPLDFEALYLRNHEDYHGFALAILMDQQSAEDAVHRAFYEILHHWPALLADGNVHQQTWAILRRTVISERLINYRDNLAELTEDSDVARALCALPPRQFDVMVLRYLCHCATDDIAWYLGVTASTVDYHGRRAKQRLEQAMPARIRRST
ncbi:sigma-70 family RNA polymerase sigma factor [Streptomyces sp. SID8379]|uniref:RNA polymerase sigma factor n=1 Tax=unclassified Streptomyces TaxID=2593676 RepID=UPI00039ABEAD|nr:MULTISPECIES: sigma-70 family RNA polymerase sigma factor [unclassified Streptomyces]MYW62894.1 sigma-70 family RNA polymerase sigma factor [Streptomyces sp. SID8379]